MPSFKQRSNQKELLDRNDIPFEDIKQNMYELDVINTYLGGHSITLDGLKALLDKTVIREPIYITELGCGGGDNLRVIKKWCQNKGLKVSLTGIDINPECITYALGRTSNAGINFICSDYKKVTFIQKPHILFTSLFCHHFNNEELIFMLKWMKAHTDIGFFINDLHRHPLAYHSIKVLTGAFSKSTMVKNDAPLSVQRGFTRQEWEYLLKAAGITPFIVKWKWAFRWLVTFCA
jgi:SAM-dependent methyltransferase